MTENDPAAPLLPGEWNPEIYAALTQLIETEGIDSENYDPKRPPIAVITCDNVLLKNDLAEAVMRYMIQRRRMKVDHNFWLAIPESMGQESIRSAYSAIAGRPDDSVANTAAYQRYRAGMFSTYETLRTEKSIAAAYLFAARMLKGQSEEMVEEIAAETLKLELNRPLAVEDIPAGMPFPAVRLETGMRICLELFDLLRVLNANGFQCWLCSGAEHHVLHVLARQLFDAEHPEEDQEPKEAAPNAQKKGSNKDDKRSVPKNPEDRIIGLKLRMQNGILGDRPEGDREPDEPFEARVPVGEERLEQFLDSAGRSPSLVIGGSRDDEALMENCEGLNIVLVGEDESFLEDARSRGWMIQEELTY